MKNRHFITLLMTVALLSLACQALAATRTEITWLGHSAYKIVTPTGKVLFIDPWVNNPANQKGGETLAAIDRADLILLTHGHNDHIGNSLEIAKKTGAQLVATFDLGKAMVQYGGYPEKQFGYGTTGHFGGQIKLLDGAVTVGFVPALHSSTVEAVEGSSLAKNLVFAGAPGGFVIKVADGPAIYHPGDTDLFSDMALVREFGKIDIFLVCIGDKFTMGPERAARAVKLVQPQLAIPMHYGTFPVLTGTPEQFAKALKADNSKAKLKVLQVGETLAWPIK